VVRHGNAETDRRARRLHAFWGEWEGEEKLAPSPWGPGGTALGRSTCRLELDGFFVIQD
jgi:hypothetical protein